MKAFKFLTAVLLFVSVLVFSGINYNQANALTALLITGGMQLTCTQAIDNGTLFEADRDNTGSDSEAYRIYITDGFGNIIHDLSNAVGVGFVAPIGTFSYNGSAPQANPLTLYFVSLAGNNLPEQLGYTVEGHCEGLPTVERCSLSVPAGSVIGEAPLGANIYYAPGAVTEHVLKPGTYHVVGQDASETYYKIVLACQFIWVRKDTMQPSFQFPQNGAPLPTRIVE